MTKQCSPRQTMRFLSSALDFRATVNKLSLLRDLRGGFLNVSIYFDRQGDHIRFMIGSRVVWETKRLDPASRHQPLHGTVFSPTCRLKELRFLLLMLVLV